MLELLSSILPVDKRKGTKGMGEMERGQGVWEDNKQMEMEQKGVKGSEAKVVNGKGPRETPMSVHLLSCTAAKTDTE